MKLIRLGSAVAVLFCLYSALPAHAVDDAACAAKRASLESEGQQAARSYSALIQKLFAPEEKRTGTPERRAEAPRIFDGIFLFDARKKGDAVEITSASTSYASNFARDLFTASSGLQPTMLVLTHGPVAGQDALQFIPNPDWKPATSFHESIAMLRHNASKLSREDKFLILASWGAHLNNGYNFAMPGEKTSMEQLFQNARNSGANGGVCRDISTYLAEVAKALGFENVGTHTGLDGKGNQAGAHVVAHFRDPSTGEYYMQNYSNIFDTHQKSLPAALDVSTRIMGSLTGVSFVESIPGQVHQYVPRTARWVNQQIEAFAKPQEDPAYITAKISNREQTLGLQLQKRLDSNKVLKGFFLRSDVQSSEGPIRLDAIGVSGEIQKNTNLSQKLLNEVGYSAAGHFGYLELTNSQMNPERPGSDQKRKSVFVAVDLKGYARINRLTGKLELEAKTIDLWTKDSRAGVAENFSAPAHRLTPSIEYRVARLPVTIGGGRSLELVPRDQYSKVALQTAYDKVNVVIDHRGKDDHVVIISNSEAYLFGGAERSNAVGLRELLSVAVPTEKHGEFAVIFDISKIAQNKNNDPFFDLPVFASIKAQWKKAVSKVLEIGTDMEVKKNGTPFFLFEQVGSVVPDLSAPKKAEIKGDLWLRMRF